MQILNFQPFLFFFFFFSLTWPHSAFTLLLDMMSQSQGPTGLLRGPISVFKIEVVFIRRSNHQFLFNWTIISLSPYMILSS